MTSPRTTGQFGHRARELQVNTATKGAAHIRWLGVDSGQSTVAGTVLAVVR